MAAIRVAHGALLQNREHVFGRSTDAPRFLRWRHHIGTIPLMTSP